MSHQSSYRRYSWNQGLFDNSFMVPLILVRDFHIQKKRPIHMRKNKWLSLPNWKYMHNKGGENEPNKYLQMINSLFFLHAERKKTFIKFY